MFLSGILARGRNGVKQSVPMPFLRLTCWLAVASWLGGIFYLSQQSEPLGATVGANDAVLAHLGLYAGLAALLLWTLLLSAPRRGPLLLWAAVAFGLAVAYGVSDEYHQSFVAGRSATADDIGFDAAGAAFGVGFALLVARFAARFSRR